MNVLFVCTGNVSRSFLAERLFRREIRRIGLRDTLISSAGLDTRPGLPGDPVIVDYLKGEGLDPGGHRSRIMTREDANWADRILVMERAHLAAIGAAWPEALARATLLLSCVPRIPEGEEIVDPFGKTLYHYRLVESQIQRAVECLARELAAAHAKKQDVQD